MDCTQCNGTGDEGGNADAEWDCETCRGIGRVQVHAPADTADPQDLAAALA